ncbi:putative Lipopolysaccharide-induced tumor necrosis factor-alpha factor-like protein [Hypsibius exemplaris]|uniref:Lipopolysaccharide-induced tumor necrosis factor-alpha factor-like protein n=1 Tax=Hypsibius exemplaris TaxID=2072580 RepID=A0A1W0WX56_HYPEX|nr:putative Lipopolysaccharide-induced tumor necrosis factor-alpha factor-like protein [Hypsibius exemplaris]
MANPHYDGKMDPNAGQVPPPYSVGSPQYAQTTTTTHTYQQQPGVTHQQTIVFMQGAQLGPNPTMVNCPNCSQQVVSVTEFENGTLTWLWVGGLCLIGCWAGCCLIPLCVDETKDVLHTCPNCRNFIGRYKRLQ